MNKGVPPIIFPTREALIKEGTDIVLPSSKIFYWNRFLQNSAAGPQTSISFGGLTFRPNNTWRVFSVSLVVVSEYAAGGPFRSVPCRLSLTSSGNQPINNQLDAAVDAATPVFDNNTHFFAFGGGDGQEKATQIILNSGTQFTIQGRAWDNYVLSDVASFYIVMGYEILN